MNIRVLLFSFLILFTFVVSFNLVVAPTVLASVPGCTVAPPGLTNWWPGDGNDEDIQSDNNATRVNGTDYDQGKVSQSFKFDGVDDYVSIQDDPIFTSDKLTLDAWVNPNTLDTYQTIISKYHFEDSNGRITDDSWLFFAHPGGQVSFIVYGTDGLSHRGVTTTNPVLTPGVWKFVAATFSIQTQTPKIYIDGVEVPTTLYDGSSILTEINDSETPILIGANFTRQLGDFWNGRIDEVEIFNKVLTDSEIQNIFTADSAGKCKTPHYRLPFEGTYTITNGPTCGTGSKQHTDFTREAIDYGLPINTPVYATEKGEIIFAGVAPKKPAKDLNGFGTHIQIRHADGSISYYAHLSQAMVTSGQVTKGQFIGYSGESGKAHGHPHLHFQINNNGGQPLSIRELPDTTWYSGDSNNPCQPSPNPDGEATGPALP